MNNIITKKQEDNVSITNNEAKNIKLKLSNILSNDSIKIEEELKVIDDLIFEKQQTDYSYDSLTELFHYYEKVNL